MKLLKTTNLVTGNYYYTLTMASDTELLYLTDPENKYSSTIAVNGIKSVITKVEKSFGTLKSGRFAYNEALNDESELNDTGTPSPEYIVTDKPVININDLDDDDFLATLSPGTVGYDGTSESMYYVNANEGGKTWIKLAVLADIE